MLPKCTRCKRPTDVLGFTECDRCKLLICLECTKHVDGRPACPDCYGYM